MSSSYHRSEKERDLYLEILKKAQMESDQALVRIIRQKMRGVLGHSSRTADGCEIFAFPTSIAKVAHAEFDSTDWKNPRLWRNIFLMLASFGFATSWFIFFCLHFLPFGDY